MEVFLKMDFFISSILMFIFYNFLFGLDGLLSFVLSVIMALYFSKHNKR